MPVYIFHFIFKLKTKCMDPFRLACIQCRKRYNDRGDRGDREMNAANERDIDNVMGSAIHIQIEHLFSQSGFFLAG